MNASLVQVPGTMDLQAEWDPPADLGDAGYVDLYVVAWGPVSLPKPELRFEGLPKSYRYLHWKIEDETFIYVLGVSGIFHVTVVLY